MSSTAQAVPAGVSYAESRQHEVRKQRMVMIDGALTANSATSEGGTSARVFDGGYWGFASVPTLDAAAADTVARTAADNARIMGRFGARLSIDMPLDHHVGEYDFNGRPPRTTKQNVELLEALNAHCKTQSPVLT